MHISLKPWIFAGVFIFAGFLEGAPLLSISGPTYQALGIGRGNGQQGAVIGFSTSTPLDDVSISVPLSVDYQSTAITAYLTNQFGPGTSAANVIEQANFLLAPNTSVPSDPQFETQTLFNGLDLAPGSYYLVVAEYDGFNNVGVGKVWTNMRTIQYAPGLEFLGSYGTAQQSGLFAPGFGGWSNTESASFFGGDLRFSVAGTAVTPEPSFLLIGGVILLFASTLKGRGRRVRD